MTTLTNLVPAKTKAQSFSDVAYHVGVEAVPVLTIDVSRTAVYYEHNTLLWKHPAVKIVLRGPANTGKRANGREQLFIAEASGPGMIAFSRDGPGRVVSLHMPMGREIEVRAHQFLAATKAVAHETVHAKGASNLLHAEHGYFVDRFQSAKGDGVLWIWAFGHVFEKTLAAGESIDIEPGAWLYKEPTVRMETVVDRLPSGPFGAHLTMFIHRFTGPGRVGVQSMYVRSPVDA